MDILNTLLEITIYSGIIYIIIMLLKKGFTNKMSPILHYAIWFVLIARLMIPATLTSPVHLFVIPIESQNQNAVVQPQTKQPFTVPEVNKAGDICVQTLMPESSQAQTATEPKTPVTSNKPSSLSLPQIIMMIWLAGSGICLLYLAALYVVLRRRFRRNAAAPSTRLMALFEEVKTEMHIKSNIRLVCQYEYGTPSLMFPKTIMMPVDALVAMNDEQVKFALCHELMHYKRGDQIMSILLSLLNAAYWFNPLVWIAFHQIRTDMEIACDGAVVKMLDAAGRTRYASLIVSLFSQPEHRYLVLGMAQANARKVAEQRVRGIFMRGKSKKSVTLISALLIAALLFTCFTTACQPTPEKPVVIGRQEDVLEAVTPVASEDFEPIEVPERVTETYDEYIKLSLRMDADVIVPKTEAYPVTEVTHKTFSDDDYLSFIKLLAGSNDELYSAWDITRDEWLQQLTELKQYKASGIATKDMINRAQEMYNKAPVEAERWPTRISDLPTDHTWSIYVNTGGDTVAQFGIRRGTSEFSYSRNMNMAVHPLRSLDKSNFSENMGDTVERWAWLQPGEPELSQEDALSIAQQYMGALGIDLELYYAELCTIVTRDVHKTTGWELTFTRTIAGLQAQRDPYKGNLGEAEGTGPSYASPWGQEFCVIAVDKDGLCTLSWYGASIISHISIPSAQLMDFDAIRQRIVDQMNYSFGARETPEGYGLDIVVTNIKLGTSLLSLKNETDKGEYLPTWYVTFDYLYKSTKVGGMAQMAFSAIDGSYVDPRSSNIEIMGRMDIGGSKDASSAGDVRGE